MIRSFPILASARLKGFPDCYPWTLIEPHEKQALKNHSQTLERLAERGGLSWIELHHVMTDTECNWSYPKGAAEKAATSCIEILAAAVLREQIMTRGTPGCDNPDGIAGLLGGEK